MSSTPRLSRHPYTDLSTFTPEEKKLRKSEIQRRYRARNKDKEKAYYAKNKAHKVSLKRANRAADPELTKEQDRESNLKKLYGLTIDAWNAMFDAQGRVCAICSTDTPTSKKGWTTDHCHSTGRVRGILCSHCNTVLGMAKDNPNTLANAITYLGK